MIVILLIIALILVFALGYTIAQSQHTKPIHDPKVRGLLGLLALLSLLGWWQQRKR